MIKVADFDLEADDFLYGATRIWCGSMLLEGSNDFIIYHVDTEEEIEYPTGSTRVSIEEFIRTLEENVPSAYNGISYDLPLLAKLHEFKYDLKHVIDPHILSRLYNPDRLGHSLRWWGERFRMFKGEHTDFSKFSNEMLQYNLQDTRILRRIRTTLQDEAGDWDWSESIKLEYHVWDIQTRQEQRGVTFDSNAALVLLDKVVKEIEEIETEIIPKIPMRLEDDGEVRKVFNKDGSYTLSVKNWIANETITN